MAVREDVAPFVHNDPRAQPLSLLLLFRHPEPSEEIVAEELRDPTNTGIRRKYSGPINLLKPTFYISKSLGERPAELIRDLIAGDRRFFEPALEIESQADEIANYNYNENLLLTQAIAEGARGAYWDILRHIRNN